MDTVGLQFGMMNMLGRLSGDSIILNMLLCCFVPVILANMPKISKKAVEDLVARLFERRSTSYTRTIVFSTGDNMTYRPKADDVTTERNNILQKALRLYINKNIDALDIKDAEMYMVQMREESRPQYRTRNLGDVTAGVKALMSYEVVKGPRENRWTLVDVERKVEFRYFTSETPFSSCEVDDFGKGGGKGGPVTSGVCTKTTFQLHCATPHAKRSVDGFIDEALAYYRSLKAASVDRSRYLFMPLPTNGSDNDRFGMGKGYGKSSSALSYKKCVLSEHKTFDSLFCPAKADILTLLDDFLNLRGKFAIAGFPNKLGLLLHGPPGTGKTSLIKCIAQYTKRHIVEVPLSKIKTNQELFDSMFDLVFPVHGEDEALRANFTDIIFIMEDVDAVSNIVHKRTDGESAADSKMGDPCNGNGKGKGRSGAEFVGKGSCSSDEEAGIFNAKGKGGFFGNEVRHGLPSTNAENPKNEKKIEYADPLNLAGLLNVLDGVVDAPGRMVIMTTNHPEKLDPALIRPGRINMSLHLGYMKANELAELMEHLMQENLSTHQRQRVQTIASSLKLTPAKVEQACAESSSVDVLLDKLSVMGSDTEGSVASSLDIEDYAGNKDEASDEPSTDDAGSVGGDQ